MATAASTLIQRVRRYVRDWPAQDVLTAAVSSTSASTITVADGTVYSQNWTIQIDDEAMVCSANGSGTSVSVRRGQFGSTAATHLNGASVLIRPAFLNVDILDALNTALDAVFPIMYRPVSTTWSGATATDYEYAIPNMATLSRPIPYLSRIEYRTDSAAPFLEVRNWRVVRGDTPVVRFASPLGSGGTLRFYGYGPFAQLTSTSDTLDTLYPSHAESLLVDFAAQQLLMSGEASRVRHDVGPNDNREAANRPGSSSGAASQLLQRFQLRLRQAPMAPLPPHVVRTF